jgi:Tfp pilus assembly protein PilN
MHAVNLLPRQLVVAPERRLGPLALVAAAAVPVVAIILVAIGYSSASSTVAAEKTKFAALQVQVAALGGATPVRPKTATTDAATMAQWNVLIGERTARRAELDAVLSQELPWDSMMRNVARILPSDVWLTQLGLTSPVTFGAASAGAAPVSTAPGAAPTNFTISGYGESEKSIALLLTRLRLLPILANVNLGTTASTVIGSKTVVGFTVTASIQTPVGVGVPPIAPAVPATTTTTPATG